MNNYRLSSSAERVAGVCVSGTLILFMLALMFVLRGDLLALIIVGLAGVLLATVLIIYLVNLFRAACIPDTDNHLLLVRGLPDQMIDLSDAVALETVAYQNGPVATRTLVFSNGDGDVVAAVPTFFTNHQGAQAEPLAMELARDLDLAFIHRLQSWEYDRDARKEHEKKLVEEAKEKRKAEWNALKRKFLRRAGTEVPVTDAAEESDMEFEPDTSSEGINYDALDDEK